MTINCPICKNLKLFSVLKLGKHPLCDDLVKIKSKKKNKLYKIHIDFCKNCITAYQKFEVSKKILFPKNYHYRSNLTKDVLLGMQDLANESFKIIKNLKNKKILDIGCNDGSLLDIFKKKKAITIGIEPTDAAKEAKSKGHQVYQAYIDKKVIKKIKKKHNQIDLILFTNVFAHIEDLKNLLKNLSLILSENTVLIIENHYLGSIIKKNQFDTFYHEHPRTYSLKSFEKISNLLNINLFKFAFPKRYGGNIRVFMSKNRKKTNNIQKILINEKKYFLTLRLLNKKISIWKENKKKEIKFLAKKFGPLPAKAFPGRAAILLKLLNLNENLISAIYEQKKSPKIGYYAPGTKIPILPDTNLKFINNKIPIINLAWHISDEIRNYLKKNKIKNKVIDILEKKDFKK